MGRGGGHVSALPMVGCKAWIVSGRLLPLMSSGLLDSIIERVRQLRERRGLSQEAFAEEAAISYKYYQAIEAGRKRDLRLSTLERLAKAHGIETWELLLPVMDEAAVAERKQARYGKRPQSTKRPVRKKK